MLLRRGVATLGLSVDQLVAWGVLYYAYTVLSRPIAADLGVPSLVVAAAFSVCLLVSGAVARRIGALVDERGTRGVVLVGAAVAPPVFASLALVQSWPSLVVVFAALGAIHALTLYEPAFRTLVDWYPEARARSRAMLAMTSVAGFASTLSLPATAWLVERHGWRTTVVVLAAVLALVLVPIRWSLPLPSRRLPHRTAPRATFHQPASLKRLALGLALHSFASTGVFVYLMWHLIARGQSAATAAAVAGLAGAAQVPGRLLLLPLRGALGAPVLPLLLVTQALALSGVVAFSGPAATACVLLFGAASGMMTLERAAVLVDWYGAATFGTHQGRLAATTSSARALSPFALEALHQLASYAAIFAALAALLLAGACLCRSAARVRVVERTVR